MKLQLVAPRRGLEWVREAFRVFARQPLGFAAVISLCLLVIVVLRWVPIAGPIALLVLPPVGSLLFMIATRNAEAGGKPMPAALIELRHAGRARFLSFLKLGVLYAASAVFAFWLASVIDGGAFLALVETVSDPKATAESAAARVAEPRLQLGLIARLLFAGALSVPFWHAPALIYWGGQSWAKSLFFSTVAIWRNKGAFTMYVLAWGALWMFLLSIVSLGVALFGPERFAYVAAAMTLTFLSVFYASLWFTFVDCFAPASGDATRPDDPSALTKGSP